MTSLMLLVSAAVVDQAFSILPYTLKFYASLDASRWYKLFEVCGVTGLRWVIIQMNSHILRFFDFCGSSTFMVYICTCYSITINLVVFRMLTRVTPSSAYHSFSFYNTFFCGMFFVAAITLCLMVNFRIGSTLVHLALGVWHVLSLQHSASYAFIAVHCRLLVVFR